MHTSRVGTGFIWIITAAVLWGTAGVTTEALYRLTDTTPFSVSAIRLLIAAPLLLAGCWRLLGRQMFVIGRRDLGLIALIGALMAVDQLLYFLAIRYAGVSVATLVVICTAPVFVTLISILFLKQRLTRMVAAVIGAAVLGTALLIGLNSTLPQSALLGAGLGLIGALVYACILLCGRFLAGTYHPLQITSIGFTVGALLLTVIASADGFVMTYSAPGWLLLGYLAVIPTALGYGLFLVGMRSTQATAASIFVLGEPLTAALLAWLLFGEQLGQLGLIGAILLVGSMVTLVRMEGEGA
jgi:drug/metabolite transporter, DME family